MKISKKRNVPWNWRNVVKLIITGILIILTFIDLVAVVFSEKVTYNVDIYSPLIKVISYVSIFSILYGNKF